MPTVFEKDGFRFFFYSNDHSPIHVHVRKGDGEAVFNVEGEVALRESQGLKLKELSRAQDLLRRIERLLLRSGMSTLVDTARTAAFIDGHIVVRMEGGLEMRFPVSRNPRLAKGMPTN